MEAFTELLREEFDVPLTRRAPLTRTMVTMSFTSPAQNVARIGERPEAEYSEPGEAPSCANRETGRKRRMNH